MPAVEESPAIRKLGRLFRVTEVHLWDDSYAAGANEGQRQWRSAESGLAGSHADKTCNKISEDTDEGHLFVEDLELANLMGSLGLPVSFSTSKVKKKTSKGKKKSIQATFEEANTQTNDDVRICVNTDDRETDVLSQAVFEHISSCYSSETALVCSEPCYDDTERMHGEGSLYVGEQKEPGCSTICSENVVACVAEHKHELEKLTDNTGDPVKSESPIQENRASEIVLQCSEEMLDHGESRCSSVRIYQEEKMSTRVNQVSMEALSVPHDNHDTDRVACPSSAEPLSVGDHALSSDSNFYYDYGDWRVIWDPFYSRYYFYNIETQESTWCPPEGLEDFESYFSTDTTKEHIKLGSRSTSLAMQENCQANDDKYLDGQGQDHCNELHDLSSIADEEPIMNQSMITTIHEAPHAGNKENCSAAVVLELDQEVASIKKKKRVRRSQSYHSCQDMAENISNDIIKYWTQRYSLFSLFDGGIKMDEEGWFSVTPELIAKHHASRVGPGVMIDCFTGVGGNAIQFAAKCKHVIAVDIDPQKINCAQHNASVYGVNDLIDFVVGNFICLAPHLKGETAFMSPPWGGPDYAKVDVYDMKAMLKPCDGYSLFKLGTMIAPRVVMFLPRNIDINQLADISLSVDPPWTVEVEKNFLNGKLKAVTAYFEKQDGLGAQ